MDFGAEGVENRSQLAAGCSRTNDGDGLGQLLQRPDVAVGQRQVAAGNRQTTRVAARTEHKTVGAELGAIFELNGVGIDKAGAAALGNDRNAGRFQMAEQLFLLVHGVDDLLRPIEQTPEVDFWCGRRQAIAFELAGVPGQAGGFGQHARGHAAVVGASAAQCATLDQRDLCAQFPCPQGRRHTGRATAQNDDINHHLLLNFPQSRTCI